MTAVDVVRIKGGWAFSQNGHRVKATGKIEREILVATLAAYKVSGEKEVLIHRDRGNLTTSQGRSKLLTIFKEKGVEIEDRQLLALEEAFRKSQGAPVAEAEETPTSGTSVAPYSLAEMEAVFRKYLLIRDRMYLPVFAGAILAHQLKSDPVWLLIVAPPGGTKTEPLRSLDGRDGFYQLSELTARTFASGLDTKDGVDHSLLAQLNDEVLVLKDFTTVLEMHREERQAILAQLREIYDGRFDKTWGTGRELHWQGRLGFVAGVTPVIDRHQQAMSVLGERFVMFRPIMPDREEMARRALEQSGHEPEMRQALQESMHGFLSARTMAVPTVTADQITTLARAADFITRARSAVLRDFRSRLEYAPEPEAPTRFSKVLLSLARGIAMAYDKTELGDQDLAMALRVALDCLPAIRHKVITALVDSVLDEDSDGELDTRGIANSVRYSTDTIRRSLEDLQALEIVERRSQGKGYPDKWILGERWAEIFKSLSDLGDREYTDADVSEEGREIFYTPPSDISATPSDSSGTTRQIGCCTVCGEHMATAESKRLGICLGCRE
jgi:hypothetical protein